MTGRRVVVVSPRLYERLTVVLIPLVSVNEVLFKPDGSCGASYITARGMIGMVATAMWGGRTMLNWPL